MASSSLLSSLGRLSLSSPCPPSPSLTPEMKDEEYSNWSELPSELITSIMQRLGVTEVLENAQKVEELGYDLEIMCRHAVDRSKGGLAEIEIWDFGTDSLINYIADSSSSLRSLKLVRCYLVKDEGLTEALVKLPLLEELEVSYGSLSGESLKAVGQSCPNLKTLKLNRAGIKYPRLFSDDAAALAIAKTMHGLCKIQLFGNCLTDAGVNAILDSCPNLEHLDLRQCFNVNIVGDMEKRCDERIKVLRYPYDSTHDYPYDASLITAFSFEFEFPDDIDQPDIDFLDFPDFDLSDDLKSLLYNGLFDER